MKLGKAADEVMEEEPEVDLEMVDMDIHSTLDCGNSRHIDSQIQHYAASHYGNSPYIPHCSDDTFDSENWCTVTRRKNRFNRGKEINWIGVEDPKEIFNIENKQGWEKIKVQIDSGAVDRYSGPSGGRQGL